MLRIDLYLSRQNEKTNANIVNTSDTVLFMDMLGTKHTMNMRTRIMNWRWIATKYPNPVIQFRDGQRA